MKPHDDARVKHGAAITALLATRHRWGYALHSIKPIASTKPLGKARKHGEIMAKTVTWFYVRKKG